MTDKSYALLSSANRPLGKGVVTAANGNTFILQITQGNPLEIADQDIVQMMAVCLGTVSYRCHVSGVDGDRFELKKLDILDTELRRSLRIPVDLDSFIYPVSGGWKGRSAIHMLDLSCGGVAFYTENELYVGEEVEIVLPATKYALIVKIQVLRKEQIRDRKNYYGAKFIDLCTDEEQKICEVVFSIEVLQRARHICDMEETI